MWVYYYVINSLNVGILLRYYYLKCGYTITLLLPQMWVYYYVIITLNVVYYYVIITLNVVYYYVIITLNVVYYYVIISLNVGILKGHSFEWG